MGGAARLPSRRIAGTMLGLAERIVNPVKERGDGRRIAKLIGELEYPGVS
jgi:hypothetical protein